MKKYSWIGCLMLLVILTGCGAAQTQMPTLTRVVLERGHGSMWGNQFYMDVCSDEILQTRYFPSDDPGGKLIEESAIAITTEQWEQIVSAVEALEPSLVPVKQTIWKKIFRQGNVHDGTEFYHLTLYWAEDEEIHYEWPDNEQAAALETLLEQLVPTAKTQ